MKSTELAEKLGMLGYTVVNVPEQEHEQVDLFVDDGSVAIGTITELHNLPLPELQRHINHKIGLVAIFNEQREKTTKENNDRFFADLPGMVRIMH